MANRAALQIERISMNELLFKILLSLTQSELIRFKAALSMLKGIGFSEMNAAEMLLTAFDSQKQQRRRDANEYAHSRYKS